MFFFVCSVYARCGLSCLGNKNAHILHAVNNDLWVYTPFQERIFLRFHRLIRIYDLYIYIYIIFVKYYICIIYFCGGCSRIFITVFAHPRPPASSRVKVDVPVVCLVQKSSRIR